MEISQGAAKKMFGLMIAGLETEMNSLSPDERREIVSKLSELKKEDRPDVASIETEEDLSAFLQELKAELLS
jgi:dihydrodipicolinate synthase/N-acetylneuraminate lyase